MRRRIEVPEAGEAPPDSSHINVIEPSPRQASKPPPVGSGAVACRRQCMTMVVKSPRYPWLSKCIQPENPSRFLVQLGFFATEDGWISHFQQTGNARAALLP